MRGYLPCCGISAPWNLWIPAPSTLIGHTDGLHLFQGRPTLWCVRALPTSLLTFICGSTSREVRLEKYNAYENQPSHQHFYAHSLISFSVSTRDSRAWSAVVWVATAIFLHLPGSVKSGCTTQPLMSISKETAVDYDLPILCHQKAVCLGQVPQASWLRFCQ